MKKLGIKFSPQSRRQLGSIKEYLLNEAGPRIASSQIAKIKSAIQRLREFPDIGLLTQSYAGPCRRWFVPPYTVLYMTDAKSIMILDILHEAQNSARYFRTE